MAVHVSPVRDLVAHDTETDECVCGPAVQFQDDDGSYLSEPVVVHHALDGRP